MPPHNQLSFLSRAERCWPDVDDRLSHVALEEIVAGPTCEYFITLINIVVPIQLPERDLLRHVAEGDRSERQGDRSQHSEIEVGFRP